MIEEELKPKPRRGKVSPEEKAEKVAAEVADNKKRLEEAGGYVSPLRQKEVPVDDPTLVAPVGGEPPVLIDEPGYLASLEAAVEVFGDELTPDTKAAVEKEIQTHRGRVANETLASKLVKIMAAIDAVEKKGRNEAMRYDYQKAVDVTKEVRREFIKHGLVLITSTRNLRTTVLGREGKAPNLYAEVDMEFILTDGIDTISFGGVGAGMDAGDKGVYKAITGALKYGLRSLLLIPDEKDDPEVPRADEMAEARPIVIESSNIKNVQQGGRQQVATKAQMDAIRTASRDLMLSPDALAAFIDVELGRSPDLGAADNATEAGKIVMDFLSGLSFAECGQIVKGLVAAAEKQRDGGA